MDYIALQLKAADKIANYGLLTSIEIATLATYDPITDSYTRATVTHDVMGLFESFDARDIDGTVIQAGDKRLLLSAIDSSTGATLPQLDEQDSITITYDGRDLSPISITPLKPGGITLLYQTHVRG